MAKGTCRCCGRENCSINADETIRHHQTEKLECQAGPDSKRCKGAGQPPAGVSLPETGTGYVCRVPAGPEGCGRPVQLTENKRARSHLNNAGHPCGGGSDWPYAVDERGNRTDTAPRAELEQTAQDIDYEQSIQDGLEESRKRIHDSVPLLNRGSEPIGPNPDLPNCPYPLTHRAGCGCPDDGSVDPSGWQAPADLLAQMPENIQQLADEQPGCWDCGHEVTPLVDRFGPDGRPEVIIWGCQENCEHRGGHPGPCRPQGQAECTVGQLVIGELFRRHTSPAPDLVFRVQTVRMDSLDAIIVTQGPYAGREGTLTQLTEEVTCTDLNGSPRPRRTPSAPRPTPDRSADPSSTPGTTPTAPRSTASRAGTSKQVTSSRPTAKAASATSSAPKKADVPDAFSTPKQAVNESDKYDRYGRYKLLHPKTGKPVNWTRATTYAKSIQDTFALSQWAQRMTLKGASLRPDIVAAVSTLEVKADKDRVNALVEDAKKAAGDKVAANLGTAVHAFTEDRDKALVGIPVKAKAVPDTLKPSVDAYELLLQSFGLEPVPGLIEFITAVLQYEIAGTSDRVYRVTRDITFKLHGRTITLYAGEYVVGDVKTGSDLSYGWLEICIQLSVYAQGLNTCGVWDWGTRTWGHPEKDGVQIQVRTDVGLIPHLPVDRKSGASLATLFAVDLDFGWTAAVLCGRVRSMRKEGNLATPLTVADVEESPEPVNEPLQRAAKRLPEVVRTRPVHTRPATLEEKAQAVTTQAGASAVWQEAVAARTPKAELDRLVGLMQKKLASHVEQGA